MVKPYGLVVFDWEGTLADTLGQIIHTVSNEAKALGFGEINHDLARQYVNLGLVRATEKLFPSLSDRQHEQLLNAVQKAMICKSSEVYLIPGARTFLDQLQQAGIALAIASNKGQQSLQRALHASQLDDFFSVIRCAGQVPAKPCPQMLEEIMEEAQVDARATLMIGDTEMDVEMAKAAGVDAIGVDFYHQQKAALLHAGAKQVFDDFKKLAAYLNQNTDSTSSIAD